VHYETANLSPPSMTAAAAVYAARCTLNRKHPWNEILKDMAGYTTAQLREFCTLDRGRKALLSPTKDI